jgi:hypothetical protein
MSKTPTKSSGAVLQFEIDRKRWAATKDTSFNGPFDDTPSKRLFNIAKTAAADTINNGGTFVLVVTADKITMVQRFEAEDID